MQISEGLRKFREKNVLTAERGDIPEIKDVGNIKKYYSQAPENFKPMLAQRFQELIDCMIRKFPDACACLEKLEKEWATSPYDLQLIIEKEYAEILVKFLMYNPTRETISQRYNSCPPGFKKMLAQEYDYLDSEYPKEINSFKEAALLCNDCTLKSKSVVLRRCEELLVNLLRNQKDLTEEELCTLHDICPSELKYLFFVA